MTHASLFSGIGGPEVAAVMLGWENVFHCEINEFGRAILDYWFPRSESYEDITKTDFSKYRGKIDVLTGGFPCQPFSYAGKRGGQTDDRYLWPEMLRVIDEIRPTWVVGENVAGITTMVESCETVDMGSESSLFQEDNGVHRFQCRHTFTIERICIDLESKGYSVQPVLIPACAIGAPHRRDRVFIIAYNIADSHLRDDVRKSRKHESESRQERIQEWNEVWKPGEPGDVRSESKKSVENPMRDGLFSRLEGKQRNQRNFRDSCPGDKEWIRGEKRMESTHSISERLEGSDESRSGEGKEWMHLWRDVTGCGQEIDLRPGERWKAFPTVSAVHRGNDGLPFDVDSLSIPFSKWRNESLKAYGNAIVPQVMYRIFQCIDRI